MSVLNDSLDNLVQPYSGSTTSTQSSHYIKCYVLSSRGKLQREDWIKPYNNYLEDQSDSSDSKEKKEKQEPEEEKSYSAVLLKDVGFKRINRQDIPPEVRLPRPGTCSVFVVDSELNDAAFNTRGSRMPLPLLESSGMLGSQTVKNEVAVSSSQNSSPTKTAVDEPPPPPLPPKPAHLYRSVPKLRPRRAEPIDPSRLSRFVRNGRPVVLPSRRRDLDEGDSGDVNRRSEDIRLPNRRSREDPGGLRGTDTGPTLSQNPNEPEYDPVTNYNLSICSSGTLTYERCLNNEEENSYESLDPATPHIFRKSQQPASGANGQQKGESEDDDDDDLDVEVDIESIYGLYSEPYESMSQKGKRVNPEESEYIQSNTQSNATGNTLDSPESDGYLKLNRPHNRADTVPTNMLGQQRSTDSRLLQAYSQHGRADNMLPAVYGQRGSNFSLSQTSSVSSDQPRTRSATTTDADESMERVSTSSSHAERSSLSSEQSLPQIGAISPENMLRMGNENYVRTADLRRLQTGPEDQGRLISDRYEQVFREGLPPIPQNEGQLYESLIFENREHPIDSSQRRMNDALNNEAVAADRENRNGLPAEDSRRFGEGTQSIRAIVQHDKKAGSTGAVCAGEKSQSNQARNSKSAHNIQGFVDEQGVEIRHPKRNQNESAPKCQERQLTSFANEVLKWYDDDEVEFDGQRCSGFAIRGRSSSEPALINSSSRSIRYHIYVNFLSLQRYSGNKKARSGSDDTMLDRPLASRISGMMCSSKGVQRASTWSCRDSRSFLKGDDVKRNEDEKDVKSEINFKNMGNKVNKDEDIADELQKSNEIVDKDISDNLKGAIGTNATHEKLDSEEQKLQSEISNSALQTENWLPSISRLKSEKDSQKLENIAVDNVDAAENEKGLENNEKSCQEVMYAKVERKGSVDANHQDIIKQDTGANLHEYEKIAESNLEKACDNQLSEEKQQEVVSSNSNCQKKDATSSANEKPTATASANEKETTTTNRREIPRLMKVSKDENANEVRLMETSLDSKLSQNDQGKTGGKSGSNTKGKPDSKNNADTGIPASQKGKVYQTLSRLVRPGSKTNYSKVDINTKTTVPTAKEPEGQKKSGLLKLRHNSSQRSKTGPPVLQKNQADSKIPTQAKEQQDGAKSMINKTEEDQVSTTQHLAHKQEAGQVNSLTGENEASLQQNSLQCNEECLNAEEPSSKNNSDISPTAKEKNHDQASVIEENIEAVTEVDNKLEPAVKTEKEIDETSKVEGHGAMLKNNSDQSGDMEYPSPIKTSETVNQTTQQIQPDSSENPESIWEVRTKSGNSERNQSQGSQKESIICDKPSDDQAPEVEKVKQVEQKPTEPIAEILEKAEQTTQILQKPDEPPQTLQRLDQPSHTSHSQQTLPAIPPVPPHRHLLLPQSPNRQYIKNQKNPVRAPPYRQRQLSKSATGESDTYEEIADPLKSPGIRPEASKSSLMEAKTPMIDMQTIRAKGGEVLLKGDLVVVDLDKVVLDIESKLDSSEEKAATNKTILPLSLFLSTCLGYDKNGNAFYIPDSFLRRFGDPTGNAWFYPVELSCRQAAIFLREERQEGCFLVYKTSSAESSPYKLSICRNTGEVVHYNIISGIGDSVSIEGHDHSFLTLPELVDYFRRNRSYLAARLRRPLKEARMPITPGYHYDSAYELHRPLLSLTGRILGRDTFGFVCAGMYQNMQVAVKVLNSLEKILEQENDFLEETLLLKELNHHNVVHLIGVSCSTRPLYIVTEYVEKGSLQNCVKNGIIDTKKQEILCNIAVQILAAVEYLSGLHFVLHRAICAKNILAADSQNIKLSEFGKAKKVRDDHYQGDSTETILVPWAAPEVLINYDYSTASDIWSVGVTLWELYSSGENPYGNFNAEQTILYVVDDGRLGQPHDCPDEIFSLISQCWKQSPTARPTAASLHQQLKLHWASVAVDAKPVQTDFLTPPRLPGDDLSSRSRHPSSNPSNSISSSNKVSIPVPLRSKSHSGSEVAVRNIAKALSMRPDGIRKHFNSFRDSFQQGGTSDDAASRASAGAGTVEGRFAHTSSSSELSLANFVPLAPDDSQSTSDKIRKSFRKVFYRKSKTFSNIKDSEQTQSGQPQCLSIVDLKDGSRPNR